METPAILKRRKLGLADDASEADVLVAEEKQANKSSESESDKPKENESISTEVEVTEDVKNLSENPLIVVKEDRLQADVELLYPLGVNQEIESLSIRRPIVNDTIIAEKLSEGERGVMFISRLANLCEVPFDEFETLDELEDLENLTEAYGLLKTDKDGDSEQNPNIKMSDDRRTCVVTLVHPVQHKDKKITALTIRRPTLKDSTDAEKQSNFNTEVLAHKYASLCGVPVDVITKLDDVDDFANLDTAVNRFRRSKARRAKKR